MIETGSGEDAQSALDLCRKRIRVRAWRRGMREMDLLLGGFADARLDALDAQMLAAFEALLDVDDDVAFRWFSGAEAVAPAHDTPLFHAIRAFHAHSGPIH